MTIESSRIFFGYGRENGGKVFVRNIDGTLYEAQGDELLEILDRKFGTREIRRECIDAAR